MIRSRPRFRRPPIRGSALVSTMLVIVVLTIIVVAFLQSMTVERQTARSYLNKYRAELAADAAQALAVNRISVIMAANPYHGVGYMFAPGASVQPGTDFLDFPTSYPVIFGSPSSTTGAAPAPYYLFSVPSKNDPTSIIANPISNTSQWPNFDSNNSIAINFKKTGNPKDPGWIGSPVDPATAAVSNQSYRECRAQWLYLLQDSSKPHNPNRASSDYNPFVARYAFWVEDETSKIDLMRAGNASGIGGAFERPQAENLAVPSDTNYIDAITWKPDHLDLGVIPIKDGKSLTPSDSGSNQLLIGTLHDSDLPLDPRVLAQVEGFSESEPAARFYTTLGSVSNELSSNGRRRININAIVHDESDDAAVITSDLDDIAYAISGKHIFTQGRSADGLFEEAEDDPSTALLPDFGERLWPSTDNKLATGTGTIPNTLKRQIYLAKISANIRDYIDADTNPTFIDRTGNVFAGTAPGNGSTPPVGTFPHTTPSGARNNTIQPYAIGKEAIPYLSKHAFSFTMSGNNLTFDQTFSFFNPHTKDFVAPAGTFLRCFERWRWNMGAFGTRQMPDFTLDLSGQVFAAGQVTVITTSPSPSSDPTAVNFSAPIGGPGRLARLAVNPADARTFVDVGGPGRIFTPMARGGSHDWYTQFVWGNPSGYYGGYSGITATALSNYRMGAGQVSPKSTVTTMRGNDAASHSGDARSLEEPIALNDPYLTGSVNADQDQYRFYSSMSNQPLATALNSYIVPDSITLNVPWPDYTPQFNNSVSTSYAIIRDQPMTSIGELGHIYDPYRRNGNNSTGGNNTGFVDYARGGGRTLRVGQPDDVPIGGNGRVTDARNAAKTVRSTGTSWTNAAWRLTEVFGILHNETGIPNRERRLIPPQANGKLNINSVARDGGAALRTLLRGFAYLPSSPHTDASLENRPLSDADIDKIVTAVQNYITYDPGTQRGGPMIERGELSQLFDVTANAPIFSGGAGGTGGTLAGEDMSRTRDRGREEIFRRLIEMLTTRSASFTVYSVGQAIRDDSSGSPTVISTATKGVTYRFDPIVSNRIGRDIPDSEPLDGATGFVATPVYIRP